MNTETYLYYAAFVVPCKTKMCLIDVKLFSQALEDQVWLPKSVREKWVLRLVAFTHTHIAGAETSKSEIFKYYMQI